MSINLNRLKDSRSSYLLQHARNPVDWWPWCDEAFEEAKKRDCPIFVSVGYASCHWCHVMEQESFEDKQCADLLNTNFVCIKIDREERPDLDSSFMTACLLLHGSGGWPMTLLLTPERKPFWAATYIPKRGSFGQLGLFELIPRIAEMWNFRRGSIDTEAAKVVDVLESVQDVMQSPADSNIGLPTLEVALTQFNKTFDHKYGGFGDAPKFPTSHNLRLLLRCWQYLKSNEALDMCERTITAMRNGGIYDQIGFGIHRYSTDELWITPHFEKMLYDQAGFALALLETYVATGRADYARYAEEILDYVSRDLGAEEGGFYSAEDADSDGVEGKFYEWNRKQLIEALGEEEGCRFAKIFGVTHPEDKPTTLHRAGSDRVRDSEWEESCLKKLGEIRSKRVRPSRDDNILTDWNAFMVVPLARAGRILNKPQYTERAKKCMDFLLTKMTTSGGKLLHHFNKATASIESTQTDYAFVIWALCELYLSTFEPQLLERVDKFISVMNDQFWDTENGGYFFTPKDQESLYGRSKEFEDSAMPSGNSVALTALCLAFELTDNQSHLDYARFLSQTFSGVCTKTPWGYGFFLTGVVDYLVNPLMKCSILGATSIDQVNEQLAILNNIFKPSLLITVPDFGALKGPASTTQPLKYQLCTGTECLPPVDCIEEIKSHI